LKKQSQFADGQIGVNSYMKGDYRKITLCVARKNKPKQSQTNPNLLHFLELVLIRVD